MAKAKAKAKAKVKVEVKVNVKPLIAFGYQAGDNVETFLEGFGYDADKHEIAEFCKSNLNIKL